MRARDSRPPRRDSFLALASVAITVLILASERCAPRPNKDTVEATLLLADENGTLVQELLVVDPTGRNLRPDDRGMIPVILTGTYEVLAEPERRWLRSFVLNQSARGIVHVLVPQR